MTASSGTSSTPITETAQTLTEAIRLQGALAHASAGALLRLHDGQRVDILGAYPAPEGDTPGWMQESAEHFASGHVESGARAFPSEHISGAHLAIIPCAPLGEPSTFCVFLLRERNEHSLSDDVGRLELGLVALRAFQTSQQADRRTSDVDRLATSIEIAGAAGGHIRFRPIAFALVNELTSRFDCERVTLGMLARPGDGDVRLVAMSAAEQVVRKTDLAHAIEGAMNESLDQDIETAWPEPEGAPMVTRAVRALTERAGQGSGLVLPIRTPEGIVGAIAMERPRPFEQLEVQTIRLAIELCAGRLWERYQRDRPLPIRAASSIRRAGAWIVGARHTWAKLLAILLFAFICFAVFAQTTDTVRAPFVVEAKNMRVLAAPFEGTLSEILVEVGDRVQVGDTLARMEDTTLRLQLADELARVRAAQTRANQARNEGEISSARIAEAEEEQSAARVRLLEHMIERSVIRAPIDGVIITGDLEGRAGSPVSTGELLFEMAPDDSLRIALSVEESAITRIEIDDPAEIAPASEPRRRIPVRLVRIAPVAREIDSGRVFRVVAEPTEPSGWLLPGMEGIGRIETGRASYASVWTRPLRDWLRLHLWY